MKNFSPYKNKNTVTILFTRFSTKLDEIRLRNYQSLLPDSLKSVVDSQRRWQDRYAKIFGLLLVKKGLAESGYSGPGLHQIQYSEHNRPYIDGAPDFNISHSGEYVVCAVAQAGRVGIDIEKHCRIRLSDYRSHLHPEVWKKIVTAEDSNIAFFACWTQIESVLKADGRGIPGLSNSICIIEDREQFEGKNWFIKPLDICSGYSCNLSTNMENVTIELQEVCFYSEQLLLNNELPHSRVGRRSNPL